ncbi:MAG: lipopolysaccharide biosynthesis protein [Acidimicrobiales bacterium]
MSLETPPIERTPADLRHLDRGSLAMAVSVGTTALGGLLFWFLAAQRGEASSVGEALALFQALVFINYVTQLGLPVLIAHHGAGRTPAASWIFRQTVVLRCTVTVVISAAMVAALWQTELFRPLHDDPVLDVAVFITAAVANGLGTLAEARLVTLRLWSGVVARHVIPATLRLPLLLFVSSGVAGSTLFLVASIPPALAGLVAATWLLVMVDRSTPKPTSVDVPHLRRYAGANAASMLLTEGPIFAAPLVVAAVIPAEETAPFLLAWSIATVAFVVPAMLGNVLVSESSQTGSIASAARRAYLLSQVGTCVLTLGAWVAADTIASIYGPDYSSLGDLLPVLVGANIAWVVTSVSLSVARAQERSSAVVGLGLLFALSTLVPIIAVVDSAGTEGVAWAWFIGNVTTALAALGIMRRVWLQKPDEA